MPLVSPLRHSSCRERDQKQVRFSRSVMSRLSAFKMCIRDRFGDAMEKLASTGLVPELERQAENGKPLLGICLGMQLLFEESYEYGEHAGLGMLPGSVCPLEPDLAAAGFSYKAVSYTHLDVYKRQLFEQRGYRRYRMSNFEAYDL